MVSSIKSHSLPPDVNRNMIFKSTVGQNDTVNVLKEIIFSSCVYAYIEAEMEVTFNLHYVMVMTFVT